MDKNNESVFCPICAKKLTRAMLGAHINLHESAPSDKSSALAESEDLADQFFNWISNKAKADPVTYSPASDASVEITDALKKWMKFSPVKSKTEQFFKNLVGGDSVFIDPNSLISAQSQISYDGIMGGSFELNPNLVYNIKPVKTSHWEKEGSRSTCCLENCQKSLGISNGKINCAK